MRRGFVVTFLSALFSGAVLQSSLLGIELVAQPDKTKLSLNEVVNLSIVLSGSGAVPELQVPAIEGFVVRRGAVQQRVEMINFKVERTVIYQFVLVPQKVGEFVVPAFATTIGGVRYATEPFKVTVVEAMKTEDVIVKVVLSREQVYVNEPVVLTLQWYFNKTISGYECTIPWLPPPAGFAMEEPEMPAESEVKEIVINDGKQTVRMPITKESYEGREYMCLTLKRILFPQSAGEYTFEPAVMRCEVVIGYRRERSLFSDFFDDDPFGRDRSVKQSVVARSEPIKLRVNELPAEGRPSDFSGLVGRFSLSASLSPQTVKLGELLTLTARVSGIGNIRRAKAPEFLAEGASGAAPLHAAFKVSDPEEESKVTVSDSGVSGEKVFRFPLRPQKSGDLAIPALGLSYFDSEAGAYKVLKAGPFRVRVESNPEIEGARVVAGTARSGGTLLGEDIAEIKTHLTVPFSRPSSTLYGLLYGLPTLVAAISLLVERELSRRRADPALVRRRTAGKTARRKLREAARSFDNPARSCELIQDALYGFIADTLGSSPGALVGRLAVVLGEKGIARELVADLERCLGEADLARFGAGTADPRSLHDQALNLLTQLEKGLR